MSHSRKEGEPERKDDSPREGEPDHQDIEEPGAPLLFSDSDGEEETKDEVDQKQAPANKPEVDIEQDLICPVTGQLFLSPVTLVPMGITIEREVAQWYVNNNYGYPSIHSEPGTQSFVENRPVANLVTRYLSQNPQAQSRQYVNGTYEFPQAALEVRPPAAAYEDVLLAEAKDDGINRGPEGAGQYDRQPVEEQRDGLIKLPFAVALKKNSVAEAKTKDSWHFKGMLWGKLESKKGYTDTIFGQRDLGLGSTTGIYFKILQLPTGRYTIHDLAAQERFRTITNSYLQHANFVLLFSPDNNTLQQLRNFGFEIQRIDYNLEARTTALAPDNNPFENNRAQAAVSANHAKEITENLFPQISSQLRIPAAAPPPAKPKAKGFFDKLSIFFERDDKKDHNDEMHQPGP